MSLSLPADPPRTRSLTGVMAQLSAALDGRSEWFAPASSAIVFVVDGLGSANLAARAGHAHFLASLGGKKDVVRSVFPSTTAAALTSLMTGTWPGEHGIVGYRARIPGTDVIANQLKGWETEGLDPLTWQRAEPVFVREAAAGRRCFVVSREQYTGSGFSTATLRGAEFVGADDVRERARGSPQTSHDGIRVLLVYLYAPDLDGVGHKRGWQSEEWAATLETVDAAARTLSDALAPGIGAVVTADHGMIDVPRHRHLLLSSHDRLVDGLRLIGGEPRMLHLYAEPDASAALLEAWRLTESSRSWVMTRDEAIVAGLFGPNVAPEVRERIGDVLVAARSSVAYYDDRLTDKGPQKMVGQHGSLTGEERIVPLLRLGAFA